MLLVLLITPCYQYALCTVLGDYTYAFAHDQRGLSAALLECIKIY